jgi:gliding motility-associated-like protein
MLKILSVIFFFSFGCYAQGEANNWYFGQWAGIDFNGTNPVALVDGQMYAEAGCATISDANGQLLFYTNGTNVWDRQHNKMPNGINLWSASVIGQSIIIIPKPGSTNIYYIITSPGLDISMNSSTKYSEVDMNLNGGLGDVTSNKNILIATGTLRNIAAIKKTNDLDYWFILHNEIDDKFYVYSVTSSGINISPIISSSKSANDGGLFFSGYLKFSPDGSKIALAAYGAGVSLFNFDIQNGTISNPQVINNHADCYGVEFSPSGDVLYTTRSDQSYNQLVQYDLTASNIKTTEKIIGIGHNMWYGSMGALQYAPNGKIYLCFGNSFYLGAINDPDNLGLSCNYDPVALQLNRETFLDLPQFVRSSLDFSIKTKNNCLGESTAFSLTGNQSLTSIDWDFGDGTNGTGINPSHIYSLPGKYIVSVSATSSLGKNIKRTKNIQISTIPTATPPQDILACEDNNDGFHTFDLTTQNTTILNGQDPDLFTVSYFANNVAIPSPTAYTNATAYQQETITAEVSNKANGECKSSTTFNIDVFDTPLPSLPTAIPNLTSCDNTSFGTDTDGKVIFDLTQKANIILNGQSATQFLISYYKDAGLTQSALTPTVYRNTNPTETIFVKVVNKDNPNCTAVTSFKIEVFALPVITDIVDLKQCDDNIDGFSVFNLEEAINKITANASIETITFHKTLVDAQNNTNGIINTTAYTNQTVSIDKVYVRVKNSNNCFRIAQLNLVVSTTQIPSAFSKTFTQCDDAVLGTNTDGITSFDFSEVTQKIKDIFPSGQLLDITYYQNVADALAEKNAIADISNYRNTSSPISQNIYIRVDSKLNNDCLGLGGYITLTTEPIPIVQSMIQNHCDDDQDGLYAFDTSAIQSNLLNGLTNVTVSYFDQNNNPLPNPLPNPFTTASQTLKVVVANATATACSFETTLQFIVDDLPEAFTIDASLTTVCDDETDPALQDGKYAFDTSTFQTAILAGQTEMTVNYFDENNNVLSSPLPNPFVTASQNIKVEVINPINPSCSATTIIPFVVNPLPNIQLIGDELVCNDLPTFTKIINAGLLDETQKNNFTYTWTLDGNPIAIETNYDLTVNKKGIYKVETANSQGCSRTRTITVNASDKATVQVDIVDLSSENSITVLATGAGDYVFSLDNDNGDYQSNNAFTNVPAGIHTVFVKDLNGCGIVPKEVAILGIPNFFTPNQDGYNDNWNLKGVNTLFNAKTTVRIFDRYGKLIKELNPMSEGWDGTYIGQQMPSTDYWYSIELQDGRIFKGHFALKR